MVSRLCNKCGVNPRKPGKSARYCEDCTRDGYPSRTGRWQQAYKFGISKARLAVMEEEQGGRCAICGQVNGSGRRLAVDHDHTCCPGKESCGECVRGLLCSNCNAGLGFFRDDPKLLESAIRYLGKKW